MGAVILLSHEFSQGLLSPRGFRIALVAVAVGMSVWAGLILNKTTRELRRPLGSPDTPIDGTVRKRRLLGIRAGKAMIVLLAVSLIFGLSQGGPLLPILVGVAVNLGMMAALIWWVVRLQKSLF